jgi:ATP-dependent 26S proteasome regulatory subunit
MLGLVDGIKRGEIFIVAATNRLDHLDPAFTRPGRFDKSIAFFPPKEAGGRTFIRFTPPTGM